MSALKMLIHSSISQSKATDTEACARASEETDNPESNERFDQPLRIKVAPATPPKLKAPPAPPAQSSAVSKRKRSVKAQSKLTKTKASTLRAPSPNIRMLRPTKLKKPNVYFQIDSHKEALKQELKRSPVLSLSELEKLLSVFCQQYKDDKTSPAFGSDSEQSSVYEIKKLRAFVQISCSKPGCKFGVRFDKEQGEKTMRFNQKSSCWSHTIDKH